MHGGTGYISSDSSIRQVWLWIKFFVSFKVDFIQAFLMSAVNLVYSETFLGSVMKCDTSEPYFLKLVNEFCNSFTTALNPLCRPFTILFVESFATFHALCVCWIQSRNFQSSISCINIWMYSIRCAHLWWEYIYKDIDRIYAYKLVLKCFC